MPTLLSLNKRYFNVTERTMREPCQNGSSENVPFYLSSDCI